MKTTLSEFTIYHEPVGKPRMTRSDKWKKRACVLEYWDYADALRKAYEASPRSTGDCNAIKIVFNLPFPPSMSASKREKLYGSFHFVRPDTDNLIKGVLDALFEKDSTVSCVLAAKYYVRETEPPSTKVWLYHLDTVDLLDM